MTAAPTGGYASLPQFDEMSDKWPTYQVRLEAFLEREMASWKTKRSGPCWFVCAVPSSLELRLHSSSPFNYQVVSKGGPVELELVVREAGGRRLANISSLDVLWDLSDYRLAKLDSHRDVTTHVDGSAGRLMVLSPTGLLVLNNVVTVCTFHTDFQVLRPRGKQGTLTVTAKVRGLSAHVLRQAALPMKQVPTVSGSLQLQLVEGLSARNSAQHQEL
ncbi:hypothetical protein MRX96_018363 [Rhipicephalus microplus]